MKNKNYLTQVRNQYENYPYPARNPLEEKRQLYISKSGSLDCLNYYCFAGAKDWTNNFRVLVAGGGTGDDTIFLAEQLRGTKAEVVYLDMSQASMKLAQERAAIRKLDNIKWVHESILNIPSLDIGTFDFIICTGVLHHLESPKAGLDALKTVLDKDGSMYLMVYATIGRTGIYQMQDLMREVNSEVEDINQEILNTKKTLSALPPGNWFTFNQRSCSKDLATDIGIYDLLLHTQDRAYTVPELYEYVEQSGLVLHKLFNSDHPLGDMAFKPETFIRDAELLITIKKLSFPKQAAICELLFGQIMKHGCFVSHKQKMIPKIENYDLVPTISVPYTRPDVLSALKSEFSKDSPKIQINVMAAVNRTAYSESLFEAIDGVRSINQVCLYALEQVNQQSSLNIIRAEFLELLGTLIEFNMVYLKSSSVKPYPSYSDMQERVS